MARTGRARRHLYMEQSIGQLPQEPPVLPTDPDAWCPQVTQLEEARQRIVAVLDREPSAHANMWPHGKLWHKLCSIYEAHTGDMTLIHDAPQMQQACRPITAPSFPIQILPGSRLLGMLAMMVSRLAAAVFTSRVQGRIPLCPICITVCCKTGAPICLAPCKGLLQWPHLQPGSVLRAQARCPPKAWHCHAWEAGPSPSCQKIHI